jgi:hypothetical protein
MYKILIKSEAQTEWIQKEFKYLVDALNCVRVHHHTSLVYPCGSVAEFVQGAMIDIR